MAADCHCGFLKFRIFLMAEAVKTPILHYRTKFREDRSNPCRDIVLVAIFKMAVAAIFDFQKFEILTLGPL